MSPVKVCSGKKNVHALKVRAFVHWMSVSYKRSPNKNFQIGDGLGGSVVVQCQGRQIFMSSPGVKHWGDTENKAMWRSVSYWRGVISRVERRLGVVILKENSVAYEVLYHEWETSDSVVARDASNRGHVWKVFHSDDGKLRLSVDWSGGEECHESHHVRDGYVDSVTFDKFVNGVLNHPDAPGIPEIAKLIFSTQEQLNQTAAGLNSIVSVIKPGEPEGSFEGVGGVPYYVG